MNTCKCWTTLLIAIVLLPNVAESADAAKEAYEKGKTFFDKGDYDNHSCTEAIWLRPRVPRTL